MAAKRKKRPESRYSRTAEVLPLVCPRQAQESAAQAL